MSLVQAVLLGIVQGLTEFLPISSSAHLVLVPALLGWRFSEDTAFVFDVLVQMGTLVAVVVYFRQDLVGLVRGTIDGLIRRRPFEAPMSRLAWLIVLATLPAVIAGLFLKDIVDQVFSDPIAVSYFLLLTAVWLVLSERIGKRTRDLDGLSAADALWVGVAQAAALFPGISRSGSTIGAGLTRHLDRQSSARFSFLMSIPVMLGASVIALNDLMRIAELRSMIAPLVVGFIAASIVGYLSIRWMLAYLLRRSLTVFAVYCAVVGVAGVVSGLLSV
jgi:undecaprenyl-diphosphatase